MTGFAAGGNIWDLFGREKRLKICGGGQQWCQVSDAVFENFFVGFWGYLDKPCCCRGVD